MPDPFLEERLSVDVRMGASWVDDYPVQIAVTASGKEYRSLTHPYPVRRFRVRYTQSKDDLATKLLALWHRAYGRYAGFRVRAMDDYTTNGLIAPPTAFDQLLATVSSGVYQLRKEYGVGASGIDIGRPWRTIFKPVAGSVLVGIRNPITGDNAITAWSVDTTTGKVTLSANKSTSITGITQASSAVITVGSHTFAVGDSVYVSGVSGMTEINGQRANVAATTGTTITVAINSSAFSAYTSGGTVQTWPQSGEEVRGGCEFDVPCRFDSPIDATHISLHYRETGEIDLVELIAL